MQLFTSVLYAAAAVFPLVSSYTIAHRANSDVTVTVSSVIESTVKVTITNNIAKNVTVLKAGSFLDSLPVYKATVFKDGIPLPHTGILLRTKTSGLTADAFTTIPAGKSVDSIFDLAATTDMSAGGVFEVTTQGAFPLATPGTTVLSGAKIFYRSNKLSITVDAARAARVPRAIIPLNKRTTVYANCSSDEQTALASALEGVVSLASAAADAALNGSPSKFQEYFMTTNATARQIVHDRLAGVAAQANRTTGGNGTLGSGTSYYCDGTPDYCYAGVLAYTLPADNIIANCKIYYSDLPHLATHCHDQDQVTTSIHEFTHAPATYSPGTDDNGYGYAAVTALTADLAIANADTYALYSNAVHLSC